MKYASAKDLRFKTRHLLQKVRRGETVGITYRGTPVALLKPTGGKEGQDWQPIGFGMWRTRKEFAQPAKWVRRKRAPRFHR